MIAGVEIHFKNECLIEDISIDKNWTARCNKNKFILYSDNLASMRKDFEINFIKFSEIEKITISDKYGNNLKSRLYQ